MALKTDYENQNTGNQYTDRKITLNGLKKTDYEHINW
jgi:hypothetical protein